MNDLHKEWLEIAVSQNESTSQLTEYMDSL